MHKIMVVILVFLVVVGSIVGLFIFLGGEQQTSTNTNQDTTSPPVTNQTVDEEFPSEQGPALILGDQNAEVLITEFIDYKCPNCNTFHRTTAEEVKAEYGDSVAFQIHQTPFIGPDSGRAARGGYCSEIHGQVFSEYHDEVLDYMYDNYYSEQNFQAEFEDILTADVLGALYFDAGGRQVDEFLACTNDLETINKYINSDQLLTAEKEVRGTPSFVVGETSLIGPQPLSVFSALIQAEL